LPTSHRFTLKKNERLKSRKQIKLLFDSGKSFTIAPIRVLFARGVEQDVPLKAAFSVSSRHFRKSVDRNRIKRLMREAYRINKGSLQEKLTDGSTVLSVFFIFIDKEIPTQQLVSEKMQDALHALQRKLP
jgi:ribonuclease P protein component